MIVLGPHPNRGPPLLLPHLSEKEFRNWEKPRRRQVRVAE